MLKAIDLTKKYGEFLAVDRISFEVDKGKILGVIGENGAGKSTTLKMLAGLLKPTSGEIYYDGKSLFENLNEIKRRIGYLPEFDALYDNLNAVEYLKVFAEIYGVDDAEKRIYNLLETLNLPDEKPVGEFSKGMKRKLSIARTLMHDPDYLIYDEPTSGLDPSTSLFVTEYIKELSKKGKTVVFSAHNMFYIEAICDLLLIIKNGRALYFGELDALRDKMKKYRVIYRIGEKKIEDVFEDVKDVNKLLAEISESGGKIISIETKVPRLEEIYFALIDEKIL